MWADYGCDDILFEEHAIGDKLNQIRGDIWELQSFIANETYSINTAHPKLAITGNVSGKTLSATIKAFDGSDPVGSAISTGSLAGADAVDEEFNEITMSAGTLEEGNTYALILSCTACDNSNKFNWRGDTAEGFGEGSGFQSGDGGDSWDDLSEDLAFKIYGDYGAWKWWFPDLYFRGCCEDCDVCVEDLT
jgi:hypothetical protein